jgi:hypothetical protein
LSITVREADEKSWRIDGWKKEHGGTSNGRWWWPRI